MRCVSDSLCRFPLSSQSIGRAGRGGGDSPVTARAGNKSPGSILVNIRGTSAVRDEPSPTEEISSSRCVGSRCVPPSKLTRDVQPEKQRETRGMAARPYRRIVPRCTRDCIQLLNVPRKRGSAAAFIGWRQRILPLRCCLPLPSGRGEGGERMGEGEGGRISSRVISRSWRSRSTSRRQTNMLPELSLVVYREPRITTERTMLRLTAPLKAFAPPPGHPFASSFDSEYPFSIPSNPND